MKQNIKKTGSWLSLMCLLVFLAACGKEGSVMNSEIDSKVVVKTEQDTNATRVISTVTGKVEVPAHPDRVIVDWNLGDVLALGVEPIGASKTILDYAQFLKPYVTDRTEDIGKDGQVSLEKMVELNPDLIITWDRNAVENYSKIAPTVVFETENFKNIHEQITAMGEILNRQKEAEEWLHSFDERVAAAKAKIQKVIPKDATFSIIDVDTTKATMVVGNTSERGGNALYQLLGAKPQALVKSEIIDKKENRLDVSWEKISNYAGDYIFAISKNDGSQAKLPSVWNSLDAVKNHHVYELDVKKYFTSDPLSALLQAEEMADLLANAKAK